MTEDHDDFPAFALDSHHLSWSKLRILRMVLNALLAMGLHALLAMLFYAVLAT